MTSETIATESGPVLQTRGTLLSVNTSSRKGTSKAPSANAVTVEEQRGVSGDAHAGDWHRQVSFLAAESIEKARELGFEVSAGSFGENFTTQGIDLLSLPLGTKLRIGNEVLVQISQIGKVCHTRCAIYRAAGDCIFPREGIFGVVLQGGDVVAGDSMELVELGDGTCPYSPPEALAEVALARETGTL